MELSLEARPHPQPPFPTLTPTPILTVKSDPRPHPNPNPNPNSDPAFNLDRISGDVLCAEVSAKKRLGLDELLDKILLQSIILCLGLD